MQETLSKISIGLECFGQFVINGCPELVFLNCYHQWSSLVWRNRNRIDSFLYSRDNGTQGYPLAMVVYGICTLLLIKQPKVEFPNVTQLCYTDDSGAMGIF